MDLVFLPVIIPFIIAYFSAGWFLSLRTDKYSWIDFFWASGFSIPIVFTIFFWQTHPISLLYAAWSIRLSWLLFKRIQSEPEDPRYKNLKKEWGENTPRNFLYLFLGEGLLVIILSLPMFLDYSQASGKWIIPSAIMFAACLFLENLADHQLATFKRKHKGQKAVCNVGLWKYSRHPNYFFEILIWFSFGLAAMDSSMPILGFVPAAIMTVMLTKVTGVPYAEKQALASRGDLFRKYQETTSVLIPWFPKENQK